jgi:hypothetical protein
MQKKSKETKPVVFFSGAGAWTGSRGIVGLVNLIHIVKQEKTPWKEWPVLKNYLDNSRVI